MRRALLVVLLALSTSGCLVLSLHPWHDDSSIEWDPALIGSWVDADDDVSMEIERSEWKSYRVKYVHPIETGTLTGYLTTIGNDRYLDLMPVRGEDRGSFLVPVHAVLRVRIEGDRLEFTSLSYDWFYERMRARATPGLQVVKDQKENALIASPTSRLREWLRAQPPSGSMFGAHAVFTRR
jgi:hypothetical protein